MDDEQFVAESIKKMLQRMGYSVTVFNNGKEALRFYSDNWKSIDLVILDMIMPIMKGKEVFRAMKNVNQEIVVILASGYSLNGEAQSILNIGANEFIQKPFDIDELRKKITNVLGKSG